MSIDLNASIDLLDISTHNGPEKTMAVPRTTVTGDGLNLAFSGIANFDIDLKQDAADRRPVIRIGFYLDTPAQLLKYAPQLLGIIRDQWIAQQQESSSTQATPEVGGGPEVP